MAKRCWSRRTSWATNNPLHVLVPNRQSDTVPVHDRRAGYAAGSSVRATEILGIAKAPRQPHRHGDRLGLIAMKAESAARGIQRRLRAARKSKLAQEVRDMDTDGLLTDRQRKGDLAIAQPARE